VKTLGQNTHLFGVSGTATDASHVVGGEVLDGHGAKFFECGEHTYKEGHRIGVGASGKFAKLTPGTPSSIGYIALLGAWPMVRITWVGVLAAFIFLRWTGFALTALTLGQFAQALVEYRRVYGRTRRRRN
jgi:hypothetical protein